VRTTQLEVRYLASPLAHPRIGVIVPRYGHSAVDRNLVKRRLRDLARTQLLPTLAVVDVVMDVVIRAAPSAYAASYDTLRAALEKATRQLPLRESLSAPSAAPTPSTAPVSSQLPDAAQDKSP
jgi:ribonuclease P protein component